MSGCFTGRPLAGAWSPTTFIMKLGSIFASAAGSSGGNSTTRIAVPLSGGDKPIGLAALSSLNESPGGDESVIHRLAAGLPEPPGLSVRRPSNSAMALLLASSPVTTRRISAAVPLEQANVTMASDQNTLRNIASSIFVERGRLYGLGSRFSKTVRRPVHPTRFLAMAVSLGP